MCEDRNKPQTIVHTRYNLFLNYKRYTPFFVHILLMHIYVCNIKKTVN